MQINRIVKAGRRIRRRLSGQARLSQFQGSVRYANAEGDRALRVVRVWKCEMWSNAPDSRPPHDGDGNVVTPEFTFNFDPRDGVEGFNWDIFDAVLATYRRADDERTLAERALVASLRDGWEKFGAPVAQLAQRIGWSPEYTRLVAKGERLPQAGPVSTHSAHTLFARDLDGSPGLVTVERGGEDPATLIAAAMTLLSRAQAMVQAGRPAVG